MCLTKVIRVRAVYTHLVIAGYCTARAVSAGDAHRLYSCISIAFHIPGSGATVVSTVINNGCIINNSGMIIYLYSPCMWDIVIAHVGAGDVLARHEGPVGYGYIYTYTNAHTRA